MSGSLANSPADVLRSAVISLSGGVLPSAGGNWPIFVNGEPSAPDNCLTFYDVDGIQEGRTQDGEIQEHEGVQLRIRATDHETGWARAELLKNIVDLEIQERLVTVTTPATGTHTYTLHAVTRRTGIMVLGKDVANTKRNLFTINVIVAITQLS